MKGDEVMNGLKTRIRQLLIVCGLAVSMTMTALPAAAVPVYAAESSETGGGASNTTGTEEDNTDPGTGSEKISTGDVSLNTNNDPESSSTEDGTQKENADTPENTDQESSQNENQGAISGGSYIDPPQTVQWVNEANLIMGISPVTGADWYDVEYNNTHSCIYPANDTHYLSSDDGLFHVNVKENLQNYEATFGEKLNSPVLVKVYAGAGSQDAAVNKADARFASFTVNNYESFWIIWKKRRRQQL